MPSSPPTVVTVNLAGIAEPGAIRAITAIAALWNIRVNPPGRTGPADGLIQVGRGSTVGVPTLEFVADVGPAAEDSVDRTRVEFSAHAGLPASLRDQSLFTPEPTYSATLGAVPVGEIAAERGGRPVWSISYDGNASCFTVATPPPCLREGQVISEILNGETFLHALPVWIFLRSLAVEPWTPAPLRACLIVDDPNLHRPGYGHIDYQTLIDFARAQPFHAAMATVPLDGWWVHAATARLFREHADALSLLVHGNDHLHHELARPFSPAQQRALLEQALARTVAVDRRAGFAVDRVMAPPHGVCAPGMIELLWQTGYEGMTTNRWSLWKHSPASSLPADSGFRPADMLGGGLPVVPRFRFKSVIGRNEIVLAAVFGQPIIPYGHHQDFSHDLAAVRETVADVNRLGPVRWMSMREILETNFETRAVADTLQVRLFSRRVKGTLPATANGLQVHLPPALEGANPTLALRWASAAGQGATEARPGETVRVPAGARFEVSLPCPPRPDGTTALPAKPPLQVLLRRLATEARDRLRL